jgi:hypothetical protein
MKEREVTKMEKMTMKEIKRLVRIGVAEDISEKKDRKDIPERYTLIGYASGIYGVNAKLIKGESGKLYAIPTRTSALYIF